MKRLFICLANSKKFSQRCIAGIELERLTGREKKYEIVRRGEEPIWVRPVSNAEHGEVSSNLVDHINLLDVVELNVVTAMPRGYQSENVLFDNRRLNVTDRIGKVETLINKLLSVETPTLFGNARSSVSTIEVSQLDHSLVLLKPGNVEVYATKNIKGNLQTRAKFDYGHTRYDLPITDIDFERRFSRNPNLLSNASHIYFTVSLGVEFNAQHYKLVAGVIYF